MAGNKRAQKKAQKAQQAESKNNNNNNNPQIASLQPRQPNDRQMKASPLANASSKNRPKANSNARVPAAPRSKGLKTTTAPQSLNPKSSQTPSSPDANRKQETDTRIERPLTAKPTTALALQSQSPTALTPQIGTSCSSTTKKASFLLLPPEIRWQIYQELFNPHRVEILRREDKKKKRLQPRKSAPYRLCHRQLEPRDAQSQRVPKEGRSFTRPFYPRTPLPTALIFTCRLTYCETIRLFYSKIQFVFNCIKPAARFLKTTSKDSQSAIKHVELSHTMYNEPQLTEFREYKFRSDRSWFLVCDEIAQKFEDLRVLHVYLEVHDWPIQMEIGERWSFPLLVFGEHKPLLDYAGIYLQMPKFANQKLGFVSRSIEQRIMKPEAFQIREDATLARQLMGSVKAKKVLRLGF